MSQKIVIAGGTGFIGRYLTKKFIDLGCQVLIISRHKNNVSWGDENGIINALEDAALLINLSGKSVNCRYHKKNREEILESRTKTTTALGEALLKCNHPPELWINSSTATIYRHALDQPMTESTGEIGRGFSVNVAKQWERALFKFDLPKTRLIALRMAIVLGKQGGVMMSFTNLVRFGLGGKQGKGNQMFSWIHEKDLFGIIMFLQSRKDLEGVFNCSSPKAVDNKTLMKLLRQTLNVKFGLPAPTWLLKVGAVCIGTETELILKSRWVSPERLLEAGYEFEYPGLDVALEDILIW